MSLYRGSPEEAKQWSCDLLSGRLLLTPPSGFAARTTDVIFSSFCRYAVLVRDFFFAHSTGQNSLFHTVILPQNVISCNVQSNVLLDIEESVYDITVDEDSTFFANGVLVHNCSPCSAARGYYPLSSGPYPGQICLGGGACRCERVVIYAPEIARQFA